MYKSGGAAIATHADWKKYTKKKVKKYVKKADSNKVVKAPGTYLKRKYADLAPMMPVTASSSSRNKTVIKYTSPRGFIGAKEELKICDTLGEINLLAGGEMYLMNGMPEGTAVNERVGRQITVKSIELRGYFVCIASTTQRVIRVAVVYDRSPNGVMPTYTDIFRPQTGALLTNLSLPVYPPNLNNRARFDILYDCQHTTSGGSSSTTNTYPSPHFDIKIDAVLGTVYMGSGALIGSIQGGALYIVFADSTEVVNPRTFDVYWTTRVRYTDA